MSMQAEERLTINIAEFARMAGCSKNQAYYLAAQGRLPVPVIRIGRRMVLSRRAVLRLLDGEIGGGNDDDGSTATMP